MKKTQRLISGAYVSIPSIGYGTAVNPEGKFRLNCPRISGNSLAVISVIGYKNVSFKANQVSESSQILLNNLNPLALPIR